MHKCVALVSCREQARESRSVMSATERITRLFPLDFRAQEIHETHFLNVVLDLRTILGMKCVLTNLEISVSENQRQFKRCFVVDWGDKPY